MRMKRFVLVLLCLMAVLALSASAATTYMESEATIADVYSIVEREYGQTVDKMTIYVSVGFGVLGICFISVIGMTWRSRNQYESMKKDLSVHLDELEKSLEENRNKVAKVLSDFADVISISISDMDVREQAAVDDVPGYDSKTREVMAKLQLIEKCRNLTEDERFLRGMNFYSAADFEAAERIFDELAGESSSENTRFWSLFNGSVCKCRLKDLKGALGSIERALAIWPDNAKAILMKATLMLNFGDLDSACQLYIDGLKNASGDVKEYGNELISFVALLMRQDRLDDAERLIGKLEAAGLDKPELRYNRICLKVRRGDSSEDLAYDLYNLLKASPGLVATALSDSDLYPLLATNPAVRALIQGLQN